MNFFLIVTDTITSKISYLPSWITLYTQLNHITDKIVSWTPYVSKELQSVLFFNSTTYINRSSGNDISIPKFGTLHLHSLSFVFFYSLCGIWKCARFCPLTSLLGPSMKKWTFDVWRLRPLHCFETPDTNSLGGATSQKNEHLELQRC